MLKLIYKDFRLTIHYFFILILPLLSAMLFLIPQWPYLIAFMYFFFVTIPTVFSTINGQRDNEFVLVMPVSKQEVVYSRISSFVIIELIHILLGGLLVILRNQLYGPANFFIDTNLTLFGLAFIMYGLFNLIFFPRYYKTGYRYGPAAIIGIVAVILFACAAEILILTQPSLFLVLEGQEGPAKFFQFMLFITGILIFLLMNIVAARLSLRNFERVDL